MKEYHNPKNASWLAFFLVLLAAAAFFSAIQVSSAQTSTSPYPDTHDTVSRIPITNSSTLPPYSFVNVGYNNYNLQVSGFSDNTGTDINCQKVAILNGVRYIFTDSGWGSLGSSQISAYSANVYWEPTALLDVTANAYSDFYVYTFPEIWPDTIVLSGCTGNRFAGSFLGFFNPVTNSFYNFIDLPGEGASYSYITQIVYVDAINRFVITQAQGVWCDYIITCTPENLINPDNWERHGPFRSGSYPDNLEHTFAYNKGDGYGYMIRYYGLTCWVERVDVHQWTSEVIYQSPGGSGTKSIRAYLATNGSSVFFTTPHVEDGVVSPDNLGIWRYWEYHNGVLTNFANKSIVGYTKGSVPENNAQVIPLGNRILISATRGGSQGALYLYEGTRELERYPASGVTWSLATETTYTQGGGVMWDGVDIVFGGEADVHPCILVLRQGLMQQCRPDFGDVYFLGADQETELPYKLTSKTDGNQATFAIDTQTVTSKFFICYGDRNRFSYGNPNLQPYLLYDDFDGTSLNTELWTDVSTGNSAFTFTGDGLYAQSGNKDVAYPRAALRSNMQFDTARTPITVLVNLRLIGDAEGAVCVNFNGALTPSQNSGLPESANILSCGSNAVSMLQSSNQKTTQWMTISNDASSYPILYKFTVSDKHLSASVGSTRVGYVIDGDLADSQQNSYVGFYSGPFTSAPSQTVLDSYAVQPRDNAWLSFRFDQTYPIEIVTDGNCWASPSGTTLVPPGADLTVSFGAENGYRISSMQVDGQPQNTSEPYTFENINESHRMVILSEETADLAMIKLVESQRLSIILERNPPVVSTPTQQPTPTSTPESTVKPTSTSTLLPASSEMLLPLLLGLGGFAAVALSFTVIFAKKKR